MLWPIDRNLLGTFSLLCILLFAQAVSGQKVGLVLSGGAAKGIAHVGVLKALEENKIPIDYLTGTSMGGVIAGCYAVGLSPRQIEEMVLSEDFQRWINGKLENDYNYYYSKNEISPSFIRINLSLDSTFSFNFKSNIANDLTLNFALAERFAVPSAIAHDNFDSLFVPLRVMASDIFRQKEVVLKSGRLGDALRATHTVPFFYEPIRIDGKYLFDGGLYNNFPVDVMQREFAPEIIIGANVSSKVFEEYPFGEDEALISKSLLYMLLDKSDPGTIPSSGVYIQPNLKSFSGIDFSKVREMIDSGYVQTMRQMPEIKSKVSSRRSPDEVSVGRQKFLSKSEPFAVDEVRFNGFNKRQQRYLSHFFSLGKGLLPITKIKSGYYNLMSEEYFKNVYPSFSKSPADPHFKLDLTRRPQKNLQVDFGGIISNRNISSMFLGANYYYFNRVLTHSAVNFNVGNFYKSAQVKIRMDFSRFGRFYLAPEGIYNEWNFLANRDLLTTKTDPTILQRFDRKFGLHVGLPVSRQLKFSLNGFYVNNSDFFSNNSVLISSDTLDRLKLTGWRTGFLLETNNLNRKQYASAGKSIFLKFDWFSLTEKYTPGNTSVLDLHTGTHHAWVRLKISAEQYWKTKSYSTGYFVEGVFSNQPVFSNYTGTIINAPGFYPMQDSRTLLLKNFRAFNYLAGGIRNIFSVRPNLDFRLEGYLFKPFEAILPGSNQETRLSRDLTRLSIGGMAAMVLHSTVGPVSLSVNYYDDKSRTFGVLLHIGYLLFQKTSTE